VISQENGGEQLGIEEDGWSSAGRQGCSMISSADKETLKRFRNDQAPVLRSRVNVLTAMALLLVPTFGIIDYHLFPAHFNSFMVYRLLASSCCFGILFINVRYNLGHQSYILGVATCYVSGAAIIMMVVKLGGFATPYYAGLNLVYIALSVFLPVGMGPVLFNSLVVYIAYLVSVFSFNPSSDLVLFAGNNMFMIATIAISAVGARINHRLRLKEYLARLELQDLQEQLKRYSHGLEIKVEEQGRDLVGKIAALKDSKETLSNTQVASIFGLAKLAESRDEATGKHLARIQIYSNFIAQEIFSNNGSKTHLPPDEVADLVNSSALHDVGKVAIPDEILLKPGKLTKEEYDLVKTHSVVGGDVLNAIDKQLGDVSFVRYGKEIAYYHHEHFDGSGYPEGLKGEQIPFSARVVAVADAYDAITSNRCYRNALSHQEAVSRIKAAKGTQFDPIVVDAFLKVESRIKTEGNRLRKLEGLLELALANMKER
jgi:response regulator RpfG family c-di-GMP phosphodiesterase